MHIKPLTYLDASDSMHDNRWEGEKEEEEEKEKEDKTKREERTKKKKEEKPKPSTPQKVKSFIWISNTGNSTSPIINQHFRTIARFEFKINIKSLV